MLDLIYLLSIVAAALALYYKFRYARGLRRVAAMLEKQQLAEKEKTSGDTESKGASETTG
jgi:uncharacterized membrane protein